MIDPGNRFGNDRVDRPAERVSLVGVVLEVVAAADGRDAERHAEQQVDIFKAFRLHGRRLFGSTGPVSRAACGSAIPSGSAIPPALRKAAGIRHR